MDENAPYSLEVPRAEPNKPLGIGKFIARFFMIVAVIGLIVVSLPFVICGGFGTGNPLFFIIPGVIIYFAIRGLKKLW